MSRLVDPTNPALWADGSPRSQNTGFTLGFGDVQIDLRALQITGTRRRGSSNPGPRGQQSGSKATRLRKALAASAVPMTSRELAEATGIDIDMVPSCMQWSISNGQILVLREKPYRYYVPAGAGDARPPGRYSPIPENQAAGQRSTDKRAAIRRGGI